MDFWERLKVEIKRNNTTQEWIATKIDVLPQTFRRWSSAKSIPSADKVFEISNLLGVTVEFLISGQDSTDPWIRENREFIAACKRLNPDQFEAIKTTVQTLAKPADSKQAAG